MPAVGVPDAVRHTGKFTIRRSPLLDVRTAAASGVRRTDLATAQELAALAPAAGESPLGLVPYQSYEFVSVPFDVRATVRAFEAAVRATVRTILRMAERERTIESRVELAVGDRAIYRLRLALPREIEVESFVAPGEYEWVVAEEPGRKVLTALFAAGLRGSAAVVARGRLAGAEKAMEQAVPLVEALDVREQSGDIVVQADPAFDVRPENLKGVETVLMQRVFAWLHSDQRPMAARTRSEPDWSGRWMWGHTSSTVANRSTAPSSRSRGWEVMNRTLRTPSTAATRRTSSGKGISPLFLP